jgi:hypothetical protein
MEALNSDGMGKKLDQINDVISNLLNGLNNSRIETERLTVVSPMDSYCESFLEYQDEESSYNESGIPQALMDKFQEMLIENDRLLMQIEDLNSQALRASSPSFEFLLSHDQVKSLNRDTANLLAQESATATLKIGPNYFILESSQKQGKIIYFTESPSKNLLQSQKNYGENTLNFNAETSYELVKLRAQLEKEQIALAKKQEYIRSLEEKLGLKIQELESIKNEYHSRLSELAECSVEKPKKVKRFSEEFYISYYSESKKKKNDLSFVLQDCGNTRKNLGKHSFLESFTSDVSKDLSVNISHIRPFNDSFLKNTKPKNKENYFIDYIREQSKYQTKKIQELKDYETYLQETWVDTFGHDKAVSALQKASQKNFQLSMSLKKERESLDEKVMRLNKIMEITKMENQRLEFHRRKILNERQILMKQQGEIEIALEKIMSFTG